MDSIALASQFGWSVPTRQLPLGRYSVSDTTIPAAARLNPLNIVAAAWDRLSNMRFAIWVLLLLALGSILGIYVGEQFPTNVPGWQEKAVEKAGPAFFSVLEFFEMFDPFRSWWYRGIVALLSLSLLACAIKRFKGSYKRAIFLSWLAKPNYYDRYDDRLSYVYQGDDPLAPVRRTLRGNLFMMKIRGDGAGGSQLASSRFGISRLGPFLSHLGLLFLVAGGLGGMLWGMKTMLWMAPGDVTNVVEVEKDGEWMRHEMPFTVALDDFQVDLNERGQVSQYRSQVRVTPASGDVFEREVSVNHPLRIAGYSFYQSSYQTAWDNLAQAEVVVSDAEGVQVGEPLHAGMGERFAIPGADGLEAEIEAFWAHAMIGEGGVRHASRQHRNPAVRFGIYRGDERIGEQLSFVQRPGAAFGSWRDMTLSFTDYREAMITGFEVSRAPLTGLIWAGLALSSIGLLLSFMVDHRQVWALAEPAGDGRWQVRVSGFTNKSPTLFAADFRRWADKWKAADEVSQMKVHVYRS